MKSVSAAFVSLGFVAAMAVTTWILWPFIFFSSSDGGLKLNSQSISYGNRPFIGSRWFVNNIAHQQNICEQGRLIAFGLGLNEFHGNKPLISPNAVRSSGLTPLMKSALLILFSDIDGLNESEIDLEKVRWGVPRIIYWDASNGIGDVTIMRKYQEFLKKYPSDLREKMILCPTIDDYASVYDEKLTCFGLESRRQFMIYMADWSHAQLIKILREKKNQGVAWNNWLSDYPRSVALQYSISLLISAGVVHKNPNAHDSENKIHAISGDADDLEKISHSFLDLELLRQYNIPSFSG